MRGEVCVGAASVLSFVSMLLMIFVHVGQINTSTVPREIFMAQVNVSKYNIQAAITDPTSNIYTNDSNAPLEVRAGLRQFYKFGLYSHCAYVNATNGICGNQTIGQQFRPYDAITLDMAVNYSAITEGILAGTTFQNSGYLGQNSKAAYWLLLLGTICTALALITGILKNSLTFFVSTIFSIAGSLMLLIGASIWTVIIKKSEAINTLMIGPQGHPVPADIFVSAGPGLFLAWAAFACLVVSIVPYMVSCCTYRG